MTQARTIEPGQDSRISWPQLRAMLRALGRDRIVRLTAVALAPMVGVFLLPLSIDFQRWFVNLTIVLALSLVVLGLRQGIDRLPRGAELRLWTDLTVAYGAWATVAVLFLFFPAPEKPLLPTLLGELGYFIYYGGLFIATERRPELGEAAPRHWDRSNLPAALLLAVGLLSYLLVLPWVYTPWQYRSIFLDTYLFLAFDLLIALRFSLRVFLVASRRWRVLYGGLALAGCLTFMADLLELTIYSQGWEHLWSTPVGAFWLVPLVVVIATVRLKHVAGLEERSGERVGLLSAIDTAWRTVLSGFSLPLIHIAARPLGLYDAALESAREQLIFVWLLAVGSLALAQSYRHHRRLVGLKRDHLELGEEVERRENEQRERARLLEELETRNAELERFVYTVSHDLKGPLFTIHGFAAALGRELDAGRSERAHEDLARISRAVSSMRHLLDDLLQLSRVGRVVNPPQLVGLAALVDEAAHRALAAHPDTASPRESPRPDLRLERDDELPMVWGDRERLLEVFENLIGNAIRYLEDQPSPRIEIHARKEGDRVHCRIADNGRGIAPEHHERVFDLFVRLDPAIEGTGIGLTLTKRIVELHGGTIHIESQGAGQGTTVCLTLPCPPSSTTS